MTDRRPWINHREIRQEQVRACIELAAGRVRARGGDGILRSDVRAAAAELGDATLTQDVTS